MGHRALGEAVTLRMPPKPHITHTRPRAASCSDDDDRRLNGCRVRAFWCVLEYQLKQDKQDAYSTSMPRFGSFMPSKQRPKSKYQTDETNTRRRRRRRRRWALVKWMTRRMDGWYVGRRGEEGEREGDRCLRLWLWSSLRKKRRRRSEEAC